MRWCLLCIVFISNHQTLTFVEGESRKTIIVTIVDDDEPEPAETFEIILTTPSNGALLGDAKRGEKKFTFVNPS